MAAPPSKGAAVNDLSARSPFDTLERAFRVLCAEPRPLAVEAEAVPGLPQRLIPLVELRSILLHPSTGYGTRNAALSVLLARARDEGGRWTVGLAGVLLFGLRRAVSTFCQLCPGKTADIEAEALTGLIEGIASTEPGRDRLAARLTWLARNRAKRLVVAELAEQSLPAHRPVPAAPPYPWGHPDLVLAQAVTEGVICAEDAALIGDTRLGLLSVTQAAETLGIDRWAAHKRRQRAEQTLVAWLCSDAYVPHFVQEPAFSPYLVRWGRPRLGRIDDRRPAACQPPTSPRR